MEEPLTKCWSCGGGFDDENTGHYDDATGVAFCCQECECMYDQQVGLPEKYQRPPN